MKSYVIDVQRCSIHDGPGIRTTVFLKGCPLRCKWCHNPESQSYKRQLSYNQSLCISCRACEEVCSQNVHSFVDGLHRVDYSKCTLCGKCVEACPSKALSMIGREMTPQEVFAIVKKDEIFYAQGGGGVTISGGEALTHIDFCLELLQLCKESHIHTCIETSGFAQVNQLRKVLPYVDLFLYDFKISNEPDALQFIGGTLSVINRTFNEIYTNEKAMILRCPIIPGVNETDEHFQAIEKIVAAYPDLIGVELLPYHNFGVVKGANIGCKTEEFDFPTEEQKQEWIQYFHQHGYDKVKLA
ncbi:glycyl-radical enzyme activating protein [Paenibacillus aquistagni]|uniref:Pyruvate formate lyase activating enzyme n=1 Tax=Paenibacillus aquistagni TaxID=1852522 RepID=A0A1X7J7L7_9BACL|nr:glycyl-radical enzyme activating protein [Paenibacillus aquistagni]SMG23317.1 pyruvate formate lyase activating enzyme [Paenibacillus aquistagni]